MGRIYALKLSIIMMGVTTLITAILPTYHQIGITATFLMIAVRLVQGLSAGAEFPAAMVYVVEVCPPEHRAKFSILCQITGFGGLIASVFVTVLNQTFATSIFITFAFGTAVEAQSLAVVSYVLRAVEGTLICLLLYLGLEMNKEDYHRLCGYCHDSCNRLCLSSTISTQEDDQYVEMNDGN